MTSLGDHASRSRKGGSHTASEREEVSHTTIYRTTDDLDVVRTMATRDGDDASTRVPHTHAMDRRCKPWRQLAVKTARGDHRSDGCARSWMDAYAVILLSAASGTTTSETTIKTRVEEGIVPIRQVVPWPPGKARRTDIESEARGCRSQTVDTHRYVVRGDTSDTPREFFR
jgi:hypothetical protein